MRKDKVETKEYRDKERLKKVGKRMQAQGKEERKKN